MGVPPGLIHLFTEKRESEFYTLNLKLFDYKEI